MNRVRGIVQHYAWGDEQALPTMLGLPPDGRPWAEVWFGTHPAGESTIAPIDRVAPAGGHPLAAVAGSLPFMVKLLAAASPLSLQTHPSAEQAAAGFARELASPALARRTYTDPNAKPELLIALSEFSALCGVRPLDATDALLRGLGAAGAEMADRLADEGVRGVLAHHLLDGHPAGRLVDECRASDRPEARLVLDLEERYPGDPAVAVSLLLNLVTMRPGQALYLGPGNLHAYLAGTGVEVMGSSDNVLRAGLTHKDVAIEELLAVVDPAPLDRPLAPLRTVRAGMWRYDTPGAPFTTYALHVNGPTLVHAHDRELVVCAVGDTDVLRRGEVLFLSPGEEVTLDGVATVFRVADAT